MSIPKLVFLFWEGPQFTYLHYLTVYSLRKYNPDYRIIVYTTNDVPTQFITWNTGEQNKSYTNVYDFNKLKEISDIEIVYIDIAKEFGITVPLSSVWKSDIVRIIKMYEHGGIYIDFDILFIKQIDESLIKIDKPIGLNYYHNTFPNGFIVAPPKSTVVEIIMNTILNKLRSNSFDKNYQQFGPTLFNNVINNNNLRNSVYLIPNIFIFPYICDTIDAFFNSNDDRISNETFCIHWYNGAECARNFCENLKIDSLEPSRNVCEKVIYSILNNK